MNSPQAGLISAEFDAIEGASGASGEPLSPEEIAYIARAESSAVAACMREQGFDYPVDDVEAADVAPAHYLSPAELRRSGYLVSAADLASPVSGDSSAVDRMIDALSASEKVAWEEMFFGRGGEEVGIADGEGDGVISVSTDGCLSDGRAELYGSIENYLRYDRALQAFTAGGVSAELAKMERYQEPMRAWQECMREAGHDVTDATDYGLDHLMRIAAVAQAGGDAVSEEEVRKVSLDDADCQEESRLHEVREQLSDDARDAVARKLSIEVGQYVAFQRAVLERAKRLGY